MAMHSKAIKISDRAYSAIRKELGIRINSDIDRIKFKDVASDLIILGFEQKEKNESLEDLTVQYIISLKGWDEHFTDSTIENIAHIVFWEHIKLALSKGFNANQAKEHVYQHLTDSNNKNNIIGIVENYLKSFKK